MSITYASNTITISGAFSSGTATGGSTTTLVDSGANFVGLTGRQVWIYAGAGAGLVAKISSSTTNTITFDRTLPVALNSTSQYVVGHNFYDLWQSSEAGGWGAVSRDNNQFSLSAKIVVGGGTAATRALLADTGKDIQFESGSVGAFVGGQYWNSAIIRWSDYSGIAFGNVLNDANKTTHQGVTLRNLNTDTTFIMGGANSDAAPTGNAVLIQLAGCQIIGSGGRTIISTGDTPGQSIMWNTALMNGVEMSPYNLDIYNVQISSSSYGSARFMGAVDKLTIASVDPSNAPLYTHTIGEVSATFKNVILRNNGYLFGIRTGCTLDCFLINPEYDNAGIFYIGGTASTAKLWEQYELDITARRQSDEAALAGVRVYLQDSTGAQVYNNTTDTSGTIPTQVLNRGYFTGASNQTRILRTPHVLKLRKYGYLFQEQGYSATSKANLGPFLAVNPYTVANESTAAEYASKISIAIVGGVAVYTISGDTTPQEMYDFTQWWASQSSNMQRDVPMVPVSPGVFYMDSSRIVIANGGILTMDTDPAIGTLVFGDRPVGTIAIEYQSGGTLNLGTANTIGTVLDFQQAITDDQQAYREGYGSIEGSGTVNWLGGTIQTHHYCAFRGNGQMTNNAEFYNEGTQTTSTGSYPSLQVDSATFQITGGLFRNTALNPFQPPAALSGLEFIACNPAVVGARNDNIYITYTGVDISDDSNIKGYIFWDDRWARFINHATGTDFLVLGNLPDDSRNRGIGEVWQNVVFAATPGSGAKFYTRDKNNGARLGAGQINANPSYTADRSYTLTESGGSAATTGTGVLTGVYWRNIGGAFNANNRLDSRGINNDTSDVFQWLKVERGQQPATANIVMKGKSSVQAEIQSLPDIGDTGSDTSGLPVTFGYAGGILTGTVTGALTLNQLHEAVCQAQVDNPAWVWDNGKAAFSATSNGLAFIHRSLSIVVNGGSLTGEIGQTLPIKPTVINGGFFEDANGAIWESGGSVYRASHFWFEIVDQVSGLPVQDAVIGFGDNATETRLLFNVTLQNTSLVTDAQGHVEGYFVYQIGTQVFDDLKMIVGHYDYQWTNNSQPASGLPIGSVTLPTVLRLSIDEEVTKTEAQAASITGLGVNVSEKLFSLGDNTLSDVYDGYKYQMTREAEFLPGFPGCMFLCIYGVPLTKAGDIYTASAAWAYEDPGAGGTWVGGTINLSLGDAPAPILGETVLAFQDAGTYDFNTVVSTTATVGLLNESGGAVTVQVPDTMIVDAGGDPTIIVERAPISITIAGAGTFSGAVAINGSPQTFFHQTGVSINPEDSDNVDIFLIAWGTRGMFVSTTGAALRSGAVFNLTTDSVIDTSIDLGVRDAIANSADSYVTGINEIGLTLNADLRGYTPAQVLSSLQWWIVDQAASYYVGAILSENADLVTFEPGKVNINTPGFFVQPADSWGDTMSVPDDGVQVPVVVTGPGTPIRKNAQGVTLHTAPWTQITADIDRATVGAAVWDRIAAEHTSPGSTGALLATAGTGGVDVGLLVDAVWSADTADYTAAGTMGDAQTSGGGGSTAEEVYAYFTDGVRADQFKADPPNLSDLATAAALANLQGTADNIAANTARIPVSPATEGAVTAIGTPLQASDYVMPDNTTIGTIASAMDEVAKAAELSTVATVIDAIKANTDNLPNDPAGVSDLPPAPDNSTINEINVKVQTLNNVDLTGIATSAELIALNDVSAAEVVTAMQAVADDFKADISGLVGPADIYAYFTDIGRPDPFKADPVDLSGIATTADITILQNTVNTISLNTERIPSNPATQEAIIAIGTPLQTIDYIAPDNSTINVIADGINNLATSEQISSLNNLSNTEVRAAVEDVLTIQGYTANRATNLDNISTPIPSAQENANAVKMEISAEFSDIELKIDNLSYDLSEIWKTDLSPINDENSAAKTLKDAKKHAKLSQILSS